MEKPEIGRVFSAFGSIANNLFQSGQILHVLLTARGGDAAQRLRPVLIVTFDDLDQLGLFEYFQMPAQVPVCQCAELLQIIEGQSFGMSKQ